MESEPVVPVIIYSDSVIREHGTGKLSLIGTFQTFTFPKFPIQFGGFWMTVYVTNIREAKPFVITARIEEQQTGHVIASTMANVNLNVQEAGKVNPDVMIEIPMRFGLCVFPHPGKYRSVVLFDGTELNSRVLLVMQVPPQTNLPLK
jgi:hypothetical protein